MVIFMNKYYGIHELAEIIQKSTLQYSTSMMDSQSAFHMADHLLGFFGYQDRIIDNMLQPQDRNVFYQLQDLNILTTESEESTLYDGREWRIHYWRYNETGIEKILSKQFENKSTNEFNELEVYSDPYNWTKLDEVQQNPNSFLSEEWNS